MRENVVTSWRCKKINKKIETSDDAVFHKESGWICECGEWTKGNDKDHIAISNGTREIYQR